MTTTLDLFGAPLTPAAAANDISYDPELSQWMTPAWAAEALVEHALPKFDDGAIVIEPSAGIGRFLDALPARYRNIGVEIDPKLAAIARGRGHDIIEGDFRTCSLPVDRADAIIGNPPFETEILSGFLQRGHALLDDGGQVIMLLPTYIFQSAANVVRWNSRWSLEQEMMPRSIFPGLRYPLMLARFTKDPKPRLSGMILYYEQAAIADMPAIYRQALAEGRSGWAAVVGKALDNLGGEAELKSIYREIEPRRPTPNQYWREKIRQILQQKAVKTDRGTWRMAA